jgi:CBS domain-containing protein
MKIKDLVRQKGIEVIAVERDTSVAAAVTKMFDRNIGALLVMDGLKPVGMFTERDVLRCYIVCVKDFAGAKVGETMSTDLIAVDIEDTVDYAMSIMDQKKVRHLPVVEKGAVISIVSIRDLVHAQVSNLKSEVHYLRDYIHG